MIPQIWRLFKAPAAFRRTAIEELIFIIRTADINPAVGHYVGFGIRYMIFGGKRGEYRIATIFENLHVFPSALFNLIHVYILLKAVASTENRNLSLLKFLSASIGFLYVSDPKKLYTCSNLLYTSSIG